MKKIILTGGGTAGHVMPNVALLPALKRAGFEVVYIGGVNGMEKDIIARTGVKYYSVSAGKLRRYIDVENIKDIFRVIKGVGDAYGIIKKEKPDVIFSKGGFVAAPVVISGRLLKTPVIIHESDIIPGLANKISMPFAEKVCVSFPETLKRVGGKGILTGPPIRGELLRGDRERGLKLCGFGGAKPVALIMGGSLGSVSVNKTVWKALDILTAKYDAVHICGRDNLKDAPTRLGYKPFGYVSDEMADIMAAADVVASRAGANSIFELLALKKPHVLIPLSKNASRGDQILNAASFETQGFSVVLQEESIECLYDKLDEVYRRRSQFIRNMSESGLMDGVSGVMSVIQSRVNAD
ncbi:MAG: undecaprenyldiphospho-muramoylpentapeptide beta-N-acetylglucosaminyltransferase [Clostridiales bacterium]|nr:undecaprenyldiphospho-muramoylpentapeptide beta-N-acetylglucosaminyltransferase [Clostridiales bacterium]